jgi:hypothetical protein
MLFRLPGSSIILLQTIQELGFGGTFRVADPYEIVTDLLFEDAVPRVDRVLPDLLEHAVLRCVRAGCFYVSLGAWGLTSMESVEGKNKKIHLSLNY